MQTATVDHNEQPQSPTAVCMFSPSSSLCLCSSLTMWILKTPTEDGEEIFFYFHLISAVSYV